MVGASDCLTEVVGTATGLDAGFDLHGFLLVKEVLE